MTMTSLEKRAYNRQLHAASHKAADEWFPRLPWIVRWLCGDRIRTFLAVLFVEGCEWQDEQKYGD